MPHFFGLPNPATLLDSPPLEYLLRFFLVFSSCIQPYLSPHISHSISLTIGRVMGSSSASSDDKYMDLDAQGTSMVPEPDLTPREGQLLQGMTNLQSQLSAVSQRQDELVRLIGVLQEQQGG